MDFLGVLLRISDKAAESWSESPTRWVRSGLKIKIRAPWWTEVHGAVFDLLQTSTRNSAVEVCHGTPPQTFFLALAESAQVSCGSAADWSPPVFSANVGPDRHKVNSRTSLFSVMRIKKKI